ncbi:hypothetical protein BC940DRAFT_327220 [Gongronella butleri]|nr:hypothetical protein BC940DRAFT_327220 [Gongronella butleri]
MSTLTLTLPRNYIYVLAAAVAGGLQVGWLQLAVGRARARARLPYPYLYADKIEAEADPKKHVFNCTQRAHQNTLEMFPMFNLLMLIGGLKHPELSAKAGALFVIGRIWHALGYRTGQPQKRVPGSVLSFTALAMIIYTSTSTVRQLLKQ